MWPCTILGWTFDTSVVGIAEQTHDVVAHQGIGQLGGDDFDEIILSLALDQMALGRRPLPEQCRAAPGGMQGTEGRLETEYQKNDRGPGAVFRIRNRRSLTQGWSMNDADRS